MRQKELLSRETREVNSLVLIVTSKGQADINTSGTKGQALVCPKSPMFAPVLHNAQSGGLHCLSQSGDSSAKEQLGGRNAGRTDISRTLYIRQIRFCGAYFAFVY